MINMKNWVMVQRCRTVFVMISIKYTGVSSAQRQIKLIERIKDIELRQSNSSLNSSAREEGRGFL